MIKPYLFQKPLIKQILLATPIAIITLYHPLSYIMLATLSLIGIWMFFKNTAWSLKKKITIPVSHPVFLSVIFLLTIYISFLNQSSWESFDVRKLEDMTWVLLLLGMIPIYQKWGSRDTIWLSIMACAFISGIVAMFEVYSHSLNFRVSGMKGKPIMFGDIAMIASLISVIAIIHFYKRNALLSFTALISAVLGLFASLQSGTRTAWLFIPVFFVIIFFILVKDNKIQFWPPILFILVFATLSTSMLPMVSSRINNAIQEINDLILEKPGSYNTSVGSRFEMWRIGLDIFREHPVTGIGIGQLNNFYKNQTDQARERLLETRHHAHNEYINTLITRGLIGFTGLITLLVGSFYFFYRHLKENLTISLSGITLISGYATFGLTDSVLFFKISLVFFFSCLYLLTGELPRGKVTESEYHEKCA